MMAEFLRYRQRHKLCSASELLNFLIGSLIAQKKKEGKDFQDDVVHIAIFSFANGTRRIRFFFFLFFFFIVSLSSSMTGFFFFCNFIFYKLPSSSLPSLTLRLHPRASQEALQARRGQVDSARAAMRQVWLQRGETDGRESDCLRQEDEYRMLYFFAFVIDSSFFFVSFLVRFVD
jgi:hypothetical protein